MPLLCRPVLFLLWLALFPSRSRALSSGEPVRAGVSRATAFRSPLAVDTPHGPAISCFDTNTDDSGQHRTMRGPVLRQLLSNRFSDELPRSP